MSRSMLTLVGSCLGVLFAALAGSNLVSAAPEKTLGREEMAQLYGSQFTNNRKCARIFACDTNTVCVTHNGDETACLKEDNEVVNLNIVAKDRSQGLYGGVQRGSLQGGPECGLRRSL